MEKEFDDLVDNVSEENISKFEQQFNTMVEKKNKELLGDVIRQCQRNIREYSKNYVKTKIYTDGRFAETMIYHLFDSEYLQNTFAKSHVYEKFFKRYEKEILEGIFDDIIKDIITERTVDKVYKSLGDYWKESIVKFFIKNVNKSELLDYNKLKKENESLKKELKDFKDTIQGVIK